MHVPDRADTSMRPFVAVFLGVMSPIVQTPVLGNSPGLAVGVQVDRSRAVAAVFEYMGMFDLVDYSNPAVIGSSFGEIMGWKATVEGRYYPFGRMLYFAGGAGVARLWADSLYWRDASQRGSSLRSGFSGTTGVVTVGAGMQWSVLFTEYRYSIGLAPIDVGGGATGRLVTSTLRLGFVFEF